MAAVMRATSQSAGAAAFERRACCRSISRGRPVEWTERGGFPLDWPSAPDSGCRQYQDAHRFGFWSIVVRQCKPGSLALGQSRVRLAFAMTRQSRFSAAEVALARTFRQAVIDIEKRGVNELEERNREGGGAGAADGDYKC